MRLQKFCFALLLSLPLSSFAADGEDHFGTWGEIGITKALPYNWDIGLNTEIRAEEKVRWGVGADVGYKPSKYVKFGVGYSYMERVKPEKRREHYRNDIVDDDYWNGYNLREGYRSPRHRFHAEITGTVKLWKWLRISVRERYQFTRYRRTEAVDTKFRYDKLYNGDGDFLGYELRDGYPETEIDVTHERSNNVLRSRLKLEVDKKGLDLSPFISCEAHNSLNKGNDMLLEKVRSAIGVEYSLNKQNRISIAYVLTCDIHDDENMHERIHDRTHAVNIGYKFKF